MVLWQRIKYNWYNNENAQGLLWSFVSGAVLFGLVVAGIHCLSAEVLANMFVGFIAMLLMVVPVLTVYQFLKKPPDKAEASDTENETDTCNS